MLEKSPIYDPHLGKPGFILAFLRLNCYLWHREFPIVGSVRTSKAPYNHTKEITNVMQCATCGLFRGASRERKEIVHGILKFRTENALAWAEKVSLEATQAKAVERALKAQPTRRLDKETMARINQNKLEGATSLLLTVRESGESFDKAQLKLVLYFIDRMAGVGVDTTSIVVADYHKPHESSLGAP